MFCQIKRITYFSRLSGIICTAPVVHHHAGCVGDVCDGLVVLDGGVVHHTHDGHGHVDPQRVQVDEAQESDK